MMKKKRKLDPKTEEKKQPNGNEEYSNERSMGLSAGTADKTTQRRSAPAIRQFKGVLPKQ